MSEDSLCTFLVGMCFSYSLFISCPESIIFNLLFFLNTESVNGLNSLRDRLLFKQSLFLSGVQHQVKGLVVLLFLIRGHLVGWRDVRVGFATSARCHQGASVGKILLLELVVAVRLNSGGLVATSAHRKYFFIV